MKLYLIQSVYWLGILLNLLLGFLFVGLFTKILKTPFSISKPIELCTQIHDSGTTELTARIFLILFAFIPFFSSVVILLDAYRRLLSCGRAELAISKKKMATQFCAMLFLGLAEGYIVYKYII